MNDNGREWVRERGKNGKVHQQRLFEISSFSIQIVNSLNGIKPQWSWKQKPKVMPNFYQVFTLE